MMLLYIQDMYIFMCHYVCMYVCTYVLYGSKVCMFYSVCVCICNTSKTGRYALANLCLTETQTLGHPNACTHSHMYMHIHTLVLPTKLMSTKLLLYPNNIMYSLKCVHKLSVICIHACTYMCMHTCTSNVYNIMLCVHMQG